MPVAVEQAYNIPIDGSRKSWLVFGERLRSVGEVMFVKLRPYDQQLINLIQSNDQKKVKSSDKKCESKRPSLTGHPGFKKLVKLRNDAMIARPGASAEDQAAAALFNDSPPSDGKKKGRNVNNQFRMNASELKALRDAPKAMDIVLPGFDDRPDMAVTVLQPAHPCDELHIKLCADTIDHVIQFVRFHGEPSVIDQDLTARPYNAIAGRGMMRNGRGRLVKRLFGDDTDDVEVNVKRRIKLLKPDGQEDDLEDEDAQGSTHASSAENDACDMPGIELHDLPEVQLDELPDVSD